MADRESTAAGAGRHVKQTAALAGCPRTTQLQQKGKGRVGDQHGWGGLNIDNCGAAPSSLPSRPRQADAGAATVSMQQLTGADEGHAGKEAVVLGLGEAAVGQLGRARDRQKDVGAFDCTPRGRRKDGEASKTTP